MSLKDGYTGLKYATMKTVTNDECREKGPLNAPVRDHSLCAYSGVNGTGICLGDSGGSLVSANELIGISSWAKLCGQGSPDGFTRISSFATWIDQNMK